MWEGTRAQSPLYIRFSAYFPYLNIYFDVNMGNIVMNYMATFGTAYMGGVDRIALVLRSEMVIAFLS